MINMGTERNLHAGKVSISPSSKKLNEDYLTYASNWVNQDEDAHICIIADGMGGHTSGNAASYYAVNFILKWWKSTIWNHNSADKFFEECQESIIDAFYEINDNLLELGRLEGKKIGTTLSVLIFVKNTYYICHVGDTRIYRFREQVLVPEKPTEDTIDLDEEKSLVQLTEDHSWAAMQVKSGQMDIDEAKSHEKAHYLTQCMGVKGDIKPFTASGSFTGADYFLLTSDGFHNLITDSTLREQWCKELEVHTEIQDICDSFYNTVKTFGFHDDVSMLMVNIGSRTEG